jgi:hypothetical protein
MLVAAGLLPERAGRPAKVRAPHFAERPAGPGCRFGAAEGVDGAGPGAVPRGARLRVGGWGDCAAWLEGHAAKAFVCNASITPTVTADVNPPSWTTWSGCAWN